MFLGRAWQHWFWDVPFRSFLWDEYLIKPIVEIFTTWEDYISSANVEAWQEGIFQGIGIIYGILAIVALVAKPTQKWMGWGLKLGAILLFLLSLLYWKEKFYNLGQLIEYTLQWSTPLFLYYAIFGAHSNHSTFRLWLKIAIALTFIGHGLYAFGYYPVPGNFVQMMVDVFGVSDALAIDLLKVAGVLDFILAIGIFIPRLVIPCLWYGVFWGFLTAFARIVANFDFDIPLESLHQWLYASVYRLPHGGIPLLLLWLVRDVE